MKCRFCGKAIDDGLLFCTNCGNRISEETEEKEEKIESSSKYDTSAAKEKIHAYSKKIDSKISKYGESKVNEYVCISGIILFLLIRVLGFIGTSLLITAINAYLIFAVYKKTGKFDQKMLLLSALVLLVGIIV